MIQQSDRLRTILQKKESPKLNEEFETNMMSLIHKRSAVENSNQKSIKFIYLFFILGLLLGLNISFSLENINIPFLKYAISQRYMAIPLVIGLIFIFDKVYKIIQFQKGNDEVFKL